MLHFFPTFGRDAAASPFGEALRRSGVPHRIYAADARLKYRTRAELFLKCIPRLAWFALRAGFASLFLARPAPRAVVLGSDIEVLIFAALRLLSLRWRTRLVLNGFIHTERASPTLNRLRRGYFRLVLSLTHLVVVYSRLEQRNYAALFPGVRFIFVPWGGSIASRAALLRTPRHEHPVVVTAGRSGRDYATLLAAMQGIDAELRIVCDLDAAVPPVPPGVRAKVLAGYYGDDYLREIAAATVVVVPLAVEDISAGQMVMIQAFGLGRPVIATRTPTIAEYADDGTNALLVPIGDAAAMRAAIRRVLDDPALAGQLGQAGMAAYDDGMDTPGHLLNLVRAMQSALGEERSPVPQPSAARPPL